MSGPNSTDLQNGRIPIRSFRKSVLCRFHPFPQPRQQRPRLIIRHAIDVWLAVAGGQLPGGAGVLERQTLRVLRSTRRVLERQFRQLQMRVRALQGVAAAPGDGERLLRQPRRLLGLARCRAQSGQVNQNVGFVIYHVDAPTAGEALVQMALGLIVIATRAMGRAQEPVGAHVVAHRVDEPWIVGRLIRQLQRPAGGFYPRPRRRTLSGR